MLQSIRDKSQGWIAWLIIGLLIATFALWGVHTYISQERNTGDIVATVDGINIAPQTVQTIYDRLRQQQFQTNSNAALNPAAQTQLKKQALNQLILSTVLLKAAHTTGYRVTTSQVNEALLQMPAFQVNGQFSIGRFQEVLGALLYTQDQFLTDLRRSMLMNQVEGGYINTAFTLPYEAGTAMRLVNQKRDIRYLIIPAARFSAQIKISPAQAQTYYQQHPQDFRAPEQVSISYIMLSLPEIAASLHFDNTKLQQYYEDNIQNYTRPASWHIAYILFKLPSHVTANDQATLLDNANKVQKQAVSGADFAQLAQKYSDDTASAHKGGELPWFTAGTLDPGLEKAAASLQQTGAISPVVKVRSGYVIIKLLGTRKSQVLPFAQVKTQVAHALAEQQAQQIFSEKSDKLANLSYADPTSLTATAQSLQLPVQHSDFFTAQGAKTGIAAHPQIVAAAFGNSVLTQRNNSNPVQIDSNTVVVLRINQYKPATLLPFAEVMNAIQSKLAHNQAQQQAAELGQQLQQAIEKQQTDPVRLAQGYHLVWQSNKDLGRYDARVDSPILAQAFRMTRPDVSHPSVSGMRLPSGDYALILLDAVHDNDSVANNPALAHIFSEQLAYNNGLIEYQFYVAGLMKKAKVKIHDNALAQPDAAPY